jgi:hypothetical protein
MKELDDKQKSVKDNIENIREFPKELKKLGSMKRIPGLVLWELNVVEFKLEKASFNDSIIDMNGEKRRTLITKNECCYVQALNKRNAVKQLKKIYKHPAVHFVIDTIVKRDNIKL